MSQVLKKEIQKKLKTKYISDQSIEWLEVNFSTSDKINLTIVSSKFDKLSYIQRKEQVIESLKQYSLKLGLLSLYTTEESDHLGIFPPSTIEDLSIKTWQDLALLAANPQNQLKQAKSSGGTTPRTVTFYSFKGGVGRTTALNHVAWLLAKRGRKVVAVDLDFEAPGLSTSFNLQQSPKYGLVDYFYDRTYLPKDSEPNVKVTDIFGEVHISDATGRLFIVPAGFLSLDYISKVDDLNAT